MTCRNLQRVRACKDALPGKPVTAYVFAQGAACFLLPLRGCGLPRRSAPRNDMLKEDARQRLQGGTAGVLPESVLAPVDTPCLLHTLRAPRPCTRAHVPAFCMSLRASAHTGVAIRNPAVKLDKLALLRANSYTLFRVRLKYCFLSCPTAESTDCHVAPLLAMTCRNLPRVRACKDAMTC